MHRHRRAPNGVKPTLTRACVALAAGWTVLAGPALAEAAPAPPSEAAPPAADTGSPAPAPSAQPPDPAPTAEAPTASEPTEATDAPSEPDDADEVADEEVADDEGADDEADEDGETEEDEEVKPPRIDGTYLGAMGYGGLGFARVNDFGTDSVFAAFGGAATIGQMVFPWLGLGLTAGGGGGISSDEGARQTMGQGYLGIEFKFVPVPKRLPLSLMTSFGFGGGAIRQEGLEGRSGYGGAQFGASVRYELFPFAKKRRPYRGGGFGLGPQLGWLGFTPAAAGRPMSNVIYLALSTTFYFGS